MAGCTETESRTVIVTDRSGFGIMVTIRATTPRLYREPATETERNGDRKESNGMAEGSKG